MSQSLPVVRPADPASFRGAVMPRAATEQPSWITGELELPRTDEAGRALMSLAKATIGTGCLLAGLVTLGSLVFLLS